MAKKRITHVKKSGLERKPKTVKMGQHQNTGSGKSGQLIHLQRQVGNRALQRQMAQQPGPAGSKGTRPRQRYTLQVERGTEKDAPIVTWRNQKGYRAGMLVIDTNENLDRFLNGEVTADQLVSQKHASWLLLSVRKKMLLAPSKSPVPKPEQAGLSPLAESIKEELQIVINAQDTKGVSDVWQEAKESKLSPEELQILRKMIAPALEKMCSQNLDKQIKAGNIKGMLQSIEPAMSVGLDEKAIGQFKERIAAKVEKISRKKVDEAIKRGDIEEMLRSLEPAQMLGIDAEVTGELMARITAEVEKITRRKVDQAIKEGDTNGALRSLEAAQMLGVDNAVVEELMKKISASVSRSPPKR